MLQQVDLWRVQCELADLQALMLNVLVNMPDRDAGPDQGEWWQQTWDEVRGQVRRVWALLPADIALADCEPLERSVLADLSEQLTAIEAHGEHITYEAVGGLELDFAAVRRTSQRLNQLAAEVADSQEAEPTPIQESADPLFSAPELAKQFGLTVDAAEARLRRWRKKHDAGWQEVSNASVNEPVILYRLSAVADVLAKPVRKRPR